MVSLREKILTPSFSNDLKSGGELLSKRIPLVKLGFLVSNQGWFLLIFHY
jgi:hypothetical protein